MTSQSSAIGGLSEQISAELMAAEGRDVRITVDPATIQRRRGSAVMLGDIVGCPSNLPARLFIKAFHGGDGGDPDSASEEAHRRFNPDSPGRSSPECRLLAERCGLDYVGQLAGPRMCPKLIAVLPHMNVIVMEELPSGPSLADVLLGASREAAQDALVSYGAAIARLHARTAGEASEFTNIRARAMAEHGLVDSRQAEHGRRRWLGALDAWLRVATEFGITVPDCSGEAESIWERAVGRRTSSFSPGDLCPDNNRLLSPIPALYDFEFCDFKPPGLDAAALRLAFPTCWCSGRIPSDAVRDMMDAYDDAYKRERRPLIGDDGGIADFTATIAWWAIASLGWDLRRAARRDGSWGLAGFRTRHLRMLRLLAQHGGEERTFPRLGKVARELAQRLRSDWGEPDEMPVFPAFRG